MFCINCGNEIEPGHKFCSACGHEVEGQVAPLHKKSNRSRPFWFFALLLVALLGGSYSLFQAVTKANVNPIIEKHLKAIRDKQITEAYYAFTSRQFQSSTPLGAFREFVEKHPQVLNNQAFKMVSEKTEGDLGVVQATLVSDKGEALNVEYRLVKEGGEWKILSIRIMEEKQGSPLDVQEIRSVVENHLSGIKEANHLSAYYNLHSKEFQKGTPLSAFEDFIRFLPLLKSHLFHEIDEVKLENGFARLRVVLLENDKRAHLEYLLTKEGNAWKIADLSLATKMKKGGEKPEDVVHEQLKAVRERELPVAYFEYFSEEYRKNTPYKDFVRFVKLNAPFGENKRAEFAKPINLGKVATLKGSLTSLQNEKALIEYELVKEDGEWKILEIEVIKNAYHQ